MLDAPESPVDADVQMNETAASGPHSVYAGGLWIRTSYDAKVQDAAEEVVRALVRVAQHRPRIDAVTEGNVLELNRAADFGLARLRAGAVCLDRRVEDIAEPLDR